MKGNSFWSFTRLDGTFSDIDGKNLHQSIRSELIEEICYPMRDRLKRPYDPSCWCRVAVDLKNSLCESVSTLLLPASDDERLSIAKDKLHGDFLTKAKHSALTIREAIKPPIVGKEQLQLTMDADPSGSFLVFEQESVGDLRASSSFDSPGAVVNARWYLVWQVLFVVDSFAEKYLAGTNYSLDHLCEHIDVPLDIFRKFTTIEIGSHLKAPPDVKGTNHRGSGRPPKSGVQSGTRRTNGPMTEVKSNGVVKKKKKKRSRMKTPGGSVPIYNGPPIGMLPGGKSFPKGWTEQVFSRQSGATEGRTDSYWFSPGNARLRSKRDVCRYLELLDKCGGDEARAMETFQCA